MDIKILIHEVKTFLLENKRIIFITTIIALICAIILQAVSYFFMNSAKEDGMGEGLSHTHSFEVYMEQDNLGAFTNSYLLESFLKQESVVREIEEDTNVEITPIIELFSENNETITTTPDDPVNVERNGSTNIMTLTFGIGTEEENLRVAESYYEWLQTTELSFFDDKQIYYMSEPHSLETLEVRPQSNSFNLASAVVRIILAIFGGAVLGLIIAFLKTLFSKKIMYSFSYGWNEEDTFLYYTDDILTKELAHSLIQPNIGNKVILSENEINTDFKNNINKFADTNTKLFFNSDVIQSDSAISVDEFIIIIKRKETSKEWYQNQRRQLKAYQTSKVKVVQI